jgi:monofunctional biosynthetic peptidoglycan transglycosylase
MAKEKSKSSSRKVSKTKSKAAPKRAVRKRAVREPLGFFARMRRRVWRAVFAVFVLLVGWIFIYTILPVPTTPYMMSEGRRLDGVDYEWVPIENMAPVLARAVVAAEDANFCNHWGLDITAIRAAIDEGRGRGASTISQQVVKNAYLWQGRSWPRKAMEALLTPVIELAWSKKRIVEVYLNIVEFDEGVFGVEAASRHYFGIGPEAVSSRQAAQLAAVLPAPKLRSAGKPSPFVRRRAASIVDGAATIAADGRSSCFED